MVKLSNDRIAPTRQAKLIVLDRDGVINYDSDQFIKSPDEWRPIPGSLEAISRLNHAGFRVIVATNQSGLGRRLFDMATLISIHDKMYKALAQLGGRVDALFYCPHTADSNCDCRKPKPGMLIEIGQRFARRPDRRALRRRRGARSAGRGSRWRAADPGSYREGRENAAQRQVSRRTRRSFPTSLFS